MVLKAPVGPREKGVLLVQFSEVIGALPGRVDLEVLNQSYRLVLEPSWSGYCDPAILQYARLADHTVVLAAETHDYDFLQGAGSTLVPVAIGPCDWVDPRVAEPHLGLPKQFDLVLNSNWAPWKRHFVLFEALRRLPRSLQVALIGVPWNNGSAEGIREIARYYGVEDRLTFFEGIPYQEVMRVTSQSRVAALLSRKEGSNRSLSEALFCDVPAILIDEHVGGIRKNVNAATGLIVPEADLARGITQLLAQAPNLQPRAWALNNVSCIRTTERLNTVLKDIALRAGEEWTTDIVVHSNSPEARYYAPEHAAALADANNAVALSLSR